VALERHDERFGGVYCRVAVTQWLYITLQQAGRAGTTPAIFITQCLVYFHSPRTTMTTINFLLLIINCIDVLQMKTFLSLKAVHGSSI
jgi:hypothetical protein